MNGVRFDGKRIQIKAVPGRISVNLHRPMPAGKILCCSFKRDHKGWSVGLVVRVAAPAKREVVAAVGVDVGLTSLATLSTGEKIENPRHTKNAAVGLRIAQRALCRCVKGSNRRQKVKTELVRYHAKIRNSRETYLHQVSQNLVGRFDLIAVEQISSGLSSGALAKHVNDAAWSRLRFMLGYKAECAGSTVVAVDPRHTSQDCSSCGLRVPKPLSERVHKCSCGLVMDRDQNAAINILHRAVVGPGAPNVAHWGEHALGNAGES